MYLFFANQHAPRPSGARSGNAVVFETPRVYTWRGHSMYYWALATEEGKAPARSDRRWNLRTCSDRRWSLTSYIYIAPFKPKYKHSLLFIMFVQRENTQILPSLLIHPAVAWINYIPRPILPAYLLST